MCITINIASPKRLKQNEDEKQGEEEQEKQAEDKEEQQKPEQDEEEEQENPEHNKEEQENPEQDKEQEKQNQNHTGMLQAPLVIAKFLTSYIDMNKIRFVLYHLPIDLSVKSAEVVVMAAFQQHRIKDVSRSQLFGQ